jgi:DNA-binding NarL/FixJ family response regulator
MWVGSMQSVPKKPKVNVNLTAKELEVLQYLKEGYSNKELADLLCVTEATIKNHLSNIFAKLEVRDRIQAVLLAIRYDLI